MQSIIIVEGRPAGGEQQVERAVEASREVEGVVIHVEARRTAVELTETLFVAGIAARPDHRPGDRLRLVIEDVRPRLGSIRLRQAG